MASTKLFRLRVKKRVSRYRVAKATGIPYTTLSRLEEGQTTNVNLKHVQTLAAYYGVSMNIKELLT